MGRKVALVIGNSQYDDEGLARLATADVDVRELAGILRADEMGQFETVTELANQSVAVVRRAIAHFFSDARRDDLLLLYFSGHGVKDEQGHLYLAVKDTERPLLAGTGIEAAFITAQMDRSHSKRQILILDCCHSGAFAYGVKGAEAAVMGVGPAFEGNGFGRVVLTATDSTQYAWEGNQVIGESDKSVFTHYLLEGLRTGHADRDGDGLITIDELYDYVYENVVSETPRQTPGKWTYKQQGEIIVARNPHPPIQAVQLPNELIALIESPFVRLRTEAVPELAGVLFGRHVGLAAAARAALERLSGDDSRKVAQAAEEVLAKLGSETAAAEVAEKQRERRASELVDRARVDFAAGRHEAAVALLEGFQPKHTIVSSVLGELRAELERTRLEEERRRLEIVRAAREKEVAAGIDTARMHIERGHFDEASRAVRRLREIDPEATGVIALTEALEAGRLAAEEAEQRRSEAQALLNAASKHFRKRDYVRALTTVEDALRQDPKSVAAIELRGEIQRALAGATATVRPIRTSADFRAGLAFLSSSRLRRAALAATIVLAAAAGIYGVLEPRLDRAAEPETSRSAQLAGETPASGRETPASGRETPPPALETPAAAPAAAPATEPRPVPPPADDAGRTPAVVVTGPAKSAVERRAAPRTPAGRSPAAPVSAGPKSSEPPATSKPVNPAEAQIARLLEQGDKQLDQRNFDAAAAAYDEAGNLGSVDGRERASKARAQKTSEVKTRMTRAERLYESGEYDAALRALDEALALDPKNTTARDLRLKVVDAQTFERGLRPKKFE